ncbi:MAG TPA: restriction endonuclease subunit S [Verrucomicrobiae bacterium]|jgi:type I restriction enzyme S subunit|nr:restriction endonuclease subunit S [Verrucomicrobiae bacterium]
MIQHPKNWGIKSLEEVAEVRTGLAKGKTDIKDPVRLPYLRVANVQDGHLDLSEIKSIQVARSEIERYRLRSGDVVLTEGGDLDKLGRGHIWNGQIDPCLHQNHIFSVRVNTQLLKPDFLALLTSSSYGRRYFSSCAKRTTNLASVNATQVRQFPVLLPAIAEQEALCGLFNTWNLAVAQCASRITASNERKRGLMQKLLMGQTRFKEFKGQRWRTWKLGELFTERVEIGRTDLPLVAITGQNGVVPRDSLAKRDISSEDKSKYLRIAPGDIGYNTMRMWQGVAGLSKIEGIVSPAYTICVPTEGILGQFAAYLFKHAPIINLFRRYSQGLVDDTLSLKFPGFAEILVAIPDLREQWRIAAVLGTCDREISLLQKQLEALKEQKRGLMQKLLTGKIGVKFKTT